MRKNLIYTLGTVATIAAPVATVVSCGHETTQTASVKEWGNTFGTITINAAGDSGEFIVGQTSKVVTINNLLVPHNEATATHAGITVPASKTVDVDALMAPGAGTTIYQIVDLVAHIGEGGVTTLHLYGKDVSLADYANNTAAQEAVNKWVEEGLKAAFPNVLNDVPSGAMDLGVLLVSDVTNTPLPKKGEHFYLPASISEAPAGTAWFASCDEIAKDKWMPITGFLRPFQDHTFNTILSGATVPAEFTPNDSAEQGVKPIEKVTFKLRLQSLGIGKILKAKEYEINFKADKTTVDATTATYAAADGKWTVPVATELVELPSDAEAVDAMIVKPAIDAIRSQAANANAVKAIEIALTGLNSASKTITIDLSTAHASGVDLKTKEGVAAVYIAMLTGHITVA